MPSKLGNSILSPSNSSFKRETEVNYHIVNSELQEMLIILFIHLIDLCLKQEKKKNNTKPACELNWPWTNRMYFLLILKKKKDFWFYNKINMLCFVIVINSC